MQLPTQHAPNPLVNSGMGMPVTSQMGNNPFLMGGMVNSQPAFGMGLPAQQGFRSPQQLQQQPHQFQNLMGNNLQAANFGAPFSGIAAPPQQSNVGGLNARFSGLQMNDPSKGGFPQPPLSSTTNGNGTLTSNLWN